MNDEGKRAAYVSALKRELKSTRKHDVDAILAELDRLGEGEKKPAKRTARSTKPRKAEKRG